MTYQQFDPAEPDATTRDGTAFAQKTRENLKALRDMVASGILIGWAGAISGGTADMPTTVTHSKGTERIRETITWGTTGGALNNPQTILYEYSSTSGSSYDTIGTITMTFDVSGNVTAWSWA